MAVTIPYPTLGTGVADSTKIDDNNAAIVNKFGNIDNSDIKSGAGISINKLSASYEYMQVNATLDLQVASTIAGPPVNNVFIPVYSDGKGDWSVVGGYWATVDTGDPSAVVKADWGVFNGAAAPGAFTSTATIATYTLVGANIASQGLATINTSTLAFGGAGVYRFLRFYVSTNDADASTVCSVSLTLKRQIAT
jgi:hypothetical protein